jgi:hypothetical protein
VGVTDADGDAVADSTRLTSTASSLTCTGSHRGDDVLVSVTAAMELRLTAASCRTRVRSRRADVAVVVVGERLRLRTDRVTVPVEGLTASSWA